MNEPYYFVELHFDPDDDSVRIQDIYMRETAFDIYALHNEYLDMNWPRVSWHQFLLDKGFKPISHDHITCF